MISCRALGSRGHLAKVIGSARTLDETAGSVAHHGDGDANDDADDGWYW